MSDKIYDYVIDVGIKSNDGNTIEYEVIGISNVVIIAYYQDIMSGFLDQQLTAFFQNLQQTEKDRLYVNNQYRISVLDDPSFETGNEGRNFSFEILHERVRKHISLVVESCKECPYRHWDNAAQEYKCTLSDTLIFVWDTNSVQSWCKLPDVRPERPKNIQELFKHFERATAKALNTGD